MNRENKRKQYEKGYYKTHPCDESFPCRNCGYPVVAADDNPVKLMSIAMKPIGSPPFPIERMAEITEKL